MSDYPPADLELTKRLSKALAQKRNAQIKVFNDRIAAEDKAVADRKKEVRRRENGPYSRAMGEEGYGGR